MAFPTETVYGLGADATDPAAVTRIFEAKGRPPTNPLIVHVDRPESARACATNGAFDGPIARLFGCWWPGPVTFVVRKSSLIPDVVTAGEQQRWGSRSPPPRSRSAHPGSRAADRRPQRQQVDEDSSPTGANHVLKDLGGRPDPRRRTDDGRDRPVFDAVAVFHLRSFAPGPDALDRLSPGGLHDLQCGIPSTSDPASHPTPSPGQLRHCSEDPDVLGRSRRFQSIRHGGAGRDSPFQCVSSIRTITGSAGPEAISRDSEVAALRLYEVLHDHR